MLAEDTIVGDERPTSPPSPVAKADQKKKDRREVIELIEREEEELSQKRHINYRKDATVKKAFPPLLGFIIWHVWG